MYSINTEKLTFENHITTCALKYVVNNSNISCQIYQNSSFLKFIHIR